MVGGTGILRPAAEALVEAGTRVTTVSRRAPPPADRLDGVAADLTRPGALRGALGPDGAFDAVLAYAPWASADNVADLAARARKVLVYVLVSAWGAPGADRSLRDSGAPPGLGRTVRLTLGWTRGTDGEVRWHTPEEVSAAGLAALGAGPDEQRLGRLRPWRERPA